MDVTYDLNQLFHICSELSGNRMIKSVLERSLQSAVVNNGDLTELKKTFRWAGIDDKLAPVLWQEFSKIDKLFDQRGIHYYPEAKSIPIN